MWWEGLNVVHLAQVKYNWRAVEKIVFDVRIPCKAENYFIPSAAVSFSRMILLYGVICK
jgi:hypothetical protein